MLVGGLNERFIEVIFWLFKFDVCCCNLFQNIFLYGEWDKLR